MAQDLYVGKIVSVPWGLNRDVQAKVVDIWGDPPEHVRVQLMLDSDEDADPVVILLDPSWLNAA